MSDRNLLFYLRRLAAEAPDKPLLGGRDGWFDAAQTLRTAEAAGRALAALGLRPGDLAALQAERCPETALMLLALRAAGAAAVLTDPRREIDDALSACEADIAPRARIRHSGGGVFRMRIGGRDETLRLGADAPDAALPEGDPRAPAFVIFTSGSTGKSKAVVLSEYSLIGNLLDAEPLGDYRKDDVALGVLPLDHVFGLVLLVGTAVLRYSLFFPETTDIPTVLRAVGRERITRMNGVPSLYLAMAEQCGGYDLSSLRTGFIGGGPCTPEQFVRIEDALGMTLISAYGMSECVGITSSSWRDPQSVRANSVGRFYAGNTGRILLADGTEAAPYRVGEICVDGRARMLGYYGDDTPRPDLLHTGDLGYIDETGRVHITGRKKDIIIRNGYTLSARRIEDALSRLPGVRAAAVVGLPDERQGEVPYAMIVGEADEDLLHSLLHKNEWPAGILRAEALPMTASGKPDKRTIREVLRSWRSS